MRKRVPMAKRIKRLYVITDNHETEQKVNYDVKINKSFSNCSSKPITIITRTGVRFKLPPNNGYQASLDKVYVDYTYDTDIGININELDQSNVGDDELEAFHRLFIESAQNQKQAHTFNNRRQMSTRSEIPISDITSTNGAVYIPAVDVVICFSEVADSIVHPYSSYGQKLLASELSEDHQGFLYNLTIVDNNGVFGARFINISGKVFKIKPVQDFSRRDGVFLTSKDEYISDGNYIESNVFEYHDFATAEKAFNLWKDAISARELGDLNHMKQTQIREREHELKKLEQDMKAEGLEAQIRKQQLEAEIKAKELKHEEEIAQMKRDNALLKEELERAKIRRDDYTHRTKAEYEYVQAQRKDTADMLKWIPTVISSVLTIAGTVMLFMAKNKAN